MFCDYLGSAVLATDGSMGSPIRNQGYTAYGKCRLGGAGAAYEFQTVYANAYATGQLADVWGGEIYGGDPRFGYLAAAIMTAGGVGHDTIVEVGSSPCSSFAADTLVATEQGEQTIVTIQAGDKVLAWDPTTGKTGYYPVAATHHHLDPVVVSLTINGETILTTPEHPFYTVAGEWVGAGHLQVGSRVYSTGSQLGTVEAVKVVPQPEVMYNLTVDQAHTFAVGNGQWLVHNAGCANNLANGMTLSVDDALDTANDFLGPGYKDMGDGRFLSVDGLRQVRMGDTDILGIHGGGPHMNFETLAANPNKPGKMMIVNNIHVYLEK